MNIVIHPPLNNQYRAFCPVVPGLVTILPPAEYLARNKDIVNACDVLYAMPDAPETLRSGTWSTIRFAKQSQKHVEILRRT